MCWEERRSFERNKWEESSFFLVTQKSLNLVELKNYIGGKFFKLNSHYYNLKIKVIFLSKKKKDILITRIYLPFSIKMHFKKSEIFIYFFP
jgi:hypothetical protein